MIKIMFRFSLLLVLFSFLCSNCSNNKKNSTDAKVKAIKNSQESFKKQDTLKQDTLDNKNLKINGKNSFYLNDTLYVNYNNDTLYVSNKDDKPIIKYYLQILISIKNLSIDTNICNKGNFFNNYLFISIYFPGDALPFKAILVDLKQQKVIVENKGYQCYLGYSENRLYHLFEGGTTASIRDFAIYDSNGVLLKKYHYYTSVEDTNQLKWLGNKLYYYSEIDDDFQEKEKLPPPKENMVYVQKNLWKENKEYKLDEFEHAFVE